MGLCQNGQVINLFELLKQVGVISVEVLFWYWCQNGVCLILVQIFFIGIYVFWLNYWLVSIGLYLLYDVYSVVVLLVQMVGYFQVGCIDGFCVGGFWGVLVVDQGQGFIIVISQVIWLDYLEKVFGIICVFVDVYLNIVCVLVMVVFDVSCFIEQNVENCLGIV